MSSKLQDRLAYPPRALRAERAAAYMGMAESTFHKLVAQGVFPPPIKLGGMRLWDRLKLDAAFDNLKTEEEQEAIDAKWKKVLE
jgi:predicted DNA-binding transcriptional regulator AlpA